MPRGGRVFPFWVPEARRAWANPFTPPDPWSVRPRGPDPQGCRAGRAPSPAQTLPTPCPSGPFLHPLQPQPEPKKQPRMGLRRREGKAVKGTMSTAEVPRTPTFPNSLCTKSPSEPALADGSGDADERMCQNHKTEVAWVTRPPDGQELAHGGSA